MMQGTKWSVGHTVIHWSDEIPLGFWQILLHLVGQYLFDANCVWRIMFAVGGGREEEFAIDISLFGIEEEEGIGMVQNIHIQKHLKHL